MSCQFISYTSGIGDELDKPVLSFCKDSSLGVVTSIHADSLFGFIGFSVDSYASILLVFYQWVKIAALFVEHLNYSLLY